MYIPRSFAEPDVETQHAFIGAHPFATLVTNVGGMFATHLPLVLRPTDGPFGTLEGHVARANDHHKRAGGGAEALVIFGGPHAHITPVWYSTKEETGRVVPTWNYVAVHAYGAVRFIDDADFLRSHLTRLTARHESDRNSTWRPTDAPDDYIAQQLRAIVGVEITIARLEGKWKMSQNREEADASGVVDGLRATGTENDAVVADLVAQRQR